MLHPGPIYINGATAAPTTLRTTSSAPTGIAVEAQSARLEAHTERSEAVLLQLRHDFIQAAVRGATTSLATWAKASVDCTDPLPVVNFAFASMHPDARKNYETFNCQQRQTSQD